MNKRREVLQRSAAVASLMMAAGVWPTMAQAQDAAAWPKAAFDAKNMADLAKSLGIAAPTESKDVTLTAPDIAENGAVVPLGAATTLAGAKRLMILVEKNPNVLTSLFDLTDSVDASISTRAKMGQSSNVYAVAVMADGKSMFAMKEVKVTLGGCGG